MVTDQIADMLTRIRNSSMVGHPAVVVPASKIKERVLSVLQNEGYIASFKAQADINGKPEIKVLLRYDNEGTPVIREIRRLSRPGRRRYVAKDDIPVFKSGLGTILVSTSKGMLSGEEARKQGIGGELICSVF